MTSYRESAEPDLPQSTPVRALVRIAGNVQGVGFRPFLFRLAAEHGLAGVVLNSSRGIRVEVEGMRCAVETFLDDIPRRRPPLAMVSELDYEFVNPRGWVGFSIAASESAGQRSAWVLPDVAVCEDCLVELFDRGDRRYRYPFVNCTHCGPRHTIIADVPYDRSRTSMSGFTMCRACQAEYDDPGNRRFHAQPNACERCGPKLWLAMSGLCDGLEAGREEVAEADPVEQAVRMLQQGAILAVKGLGGFHLACDASNADAVARLRRRKQRPDKPFAMMVPDLKAAAAYCQLDEEARRILSSPTRPITLLPRQANAPVVEGVAPGRCQLGIMLPYTPLHHLLLLDAGRQPRFQGLVMTSGNRSEEPLAIENGEAVQRLGKIADAFLLHDREILRCADDSVVCYDPDFRERRDNEVSAGATMIRRSRGYVPAPLVLDRAVGEVLAVGGHLKNTLAVSRGNCVFLSQHIGDLDNWDTLARWRHTAQQMRQVLDVSPTVVAHDLHPDYLSTQLAGEFGDASRVAVQHHHAHVVACMAEHHLEGPVIGIALDGTGYGEDGQIWGGEILIAEYDRFHRAGHLGYVPLPGGEKAIQEPWRVALSHLDAVYGDGLWELPIPFVRQLQREVADLLLRATHRGINAPLTSSCGRLFDAIAALLGVRQKVSYEGQAAMELESIITPDIQAVNDLPASYQQEVMDSVSVASGIATGCVLDTTCLITAVVADIQAGIPLARISWRFHQALAQLLAESVQRLARRAELGQVVLSGGCMQNLILRRALTARLEQAGLAVFAPCKFPANDGGLALGQLLVAAARSRDSRK